MTHQLRLVDESTLTWSRGGRARRDRPAGVLGADGGKTNYVWMRWVSPTGERGPWSEQAQATIAA